MPCCCGWYIGGGVSIACSPCPIGIAPLGAFGVFLIAFLFLRRRRIQQHTQTSVSKTRTTATTATTMYIIFRAVEGRPLKWSSESSSESSKTFERTKVGVGCAVVVYTGRGALSSPPPPPESPRLGLLRPPRPASTGAVRVRRSEVKRARGIIALLAGIGFGGVNNVYESSD